MQTKGRLARHASPVAVSQKQGRHRQKLTFEDWLSTICTSEYFEAGHFYTEHTNSEHTNSDHHRH